MGKIYRGVEVNTNDSEPEQWLPVEVVAGFIAMDRCKLAGLTNLNG